MAGGNKSFPPSELGKLISPSLFFLFLVSETKGLEIVFVFSLRRRKRWEAYGVFSFVVVVVVVENAVAYIVREWKIQMKYG